MQNHARVKDIGSLVDRGSNGGVGGADVNVLDYVYQDGVYKVVNNNLKIIIKEVLGQKNLELYAIECYRVPGCTPLCRNFL